MELLVAGCFLVAGCVLAATSKSRQHLSSLKYPHHRFSLVTCFVLLPLFAVYNLQRTLKTYMFMFDLFLKLFFCEKICRLSKKALLPSGGLFGRST